MEEPIIKAYLYGDNIITESEKFIYEVSIYRVQKNRFNCVVSKQYILNHPVKKTGLLIKKYNKDIILIKYIDLLSAPRSFIDENNLKIYESNRTKASNRRSKRH